MKHFYFACLTIFSLTISIQAQGESSLVDVGGYNMHFNIIKGEGVPILFEAGGGNDSSVWAPILESIYNVTGTTLITYDRSGFGKSELNPDLKKETDFGIENGIKELEIGLTKLGYDGQIILVSHSYGGLYNMLYARKYPEKVISIVSIDATPSEFWNEELLSMRDMNVDITTIPKPSGDYYMNYNYNATMRYVRGMKFSENIPVTNIFPENSFPDFPEILSTRWRTLQEELGDKNENIHNIIAKNSGHAVFQDNPTLIINSVIKAYAKTLDKNQQIILLPKVLNNAIDLSIQSKYNNRTAHDINTLGYSLMANQDMDNALVIFKAATLLFPHNANAYDSYGEALLAVNKTEEAIKMYEKSIELNPENDHGKSILEELKRK